MEAQKGYYSLVQFCPDRGRAEAVNIGVVLLVPAIKHLAVRTIKTSRRITQVFGKGTVDSWWLKTSRESFERRLLTEHAAGRFTSPEGLNEYLATLGNDIVPTPARPTRVENLNADLLRLFTRLVEPASEEGVPTLPHIVKPLEDAFVELRARLVYVGIENSFPIEGLGHAVRADYDYRNGTANLIRLLRIGRSRPGRAIKEAIDLGGESVLVDKHLLVHGLKAKLIVVVAPEKQDEKTDAIEREIERIDKDFPAEYVLSRAIPAFADQVKSEAE